MKTQLGRATLTGICSCNSIFAGVADVGADGEWKDKLNNATINKNLGNKFLTNEAARDCSDIILIEGESTKIA